MAKPRETFVNSRGELLLDTYEPLIPREEKTPMEIFTFNLRWKKLMLLVAVWAAFLVLQVIKNDLVVCSTWYWIYLDPKARNDTEYKLETFSGVYRKLSGKDVVFEYPMTEA
ncbi:Transmembrane protein TauE like protein [Artemisia annua]|uniref:40S ribosomal protein S7 n=1 Tax=Artemisia annua TaxID=35608 RepID=A0A2U1MNZ7_ARTAN|nr:Transmembrane protein TauE like protein [Artemisia annua]